jgi:hypothetical protein
VPGRGGEEGIGGLERGCGMGLELISILIFDIFVFALMFMHSTYNQVHSTAQHSREGEERGLGDVIGRVNTPVPRSGLALS